MGGSAPISALFRETQKFTQVWIWAVMVVVVILGLALPLYSIVMILYKSQSWSSAPLWSKGGLILNALPVLIVLGIVWMMAVFKLTTEVRPEGLFIKMFPFHWSFREIPQEGVERFEAITYRPMGDYGGWGLRFGKGGRACNVKGNEGVRIDYKDGRHILIGSQRAKELAEALAGVWGGYSA